MKKLLGAVVAAVCIASSVFAAESVPTQNYINVAYSYNYTGSVGLESGVSESLTFNGIDFSFYQYNLEKPLGFFASAFFYMPSSGHLTVGSAEYDAVRASGFMYSVGYGLAYKFNFTPAFTLQLGAGFDVCGFFAGADFNDGNGLIGGANGYFGVLADVNAVYNITDLITVTGGVKINYEFFDYTSLLNGGNGNCPWYMLRPYAGIGFRF